MESIARSAYQAYLEFLSKGSANVKNLFLKNVSSLLIENKNEILKENKKDIEQGKKEGLTQPVLDRIMLSEERIINMSRACLEIADLPDPIGKMDSIEKRPQGFTLGKIRTPIGVIGMIYEARPNVTIEAAALCLKSGNAVILRGGSSSYYSNHALLKILKEACNMSGLNSNLVSHLPSQDKSLVQEMLSLDKWIHLIIPRGGASFIQYVKENSKIPVLKHDRGLCHLYIHKDADVASAVKIADNSKNQRPSVCNALETLLVHESIAPVFLPELWVKIKDETEIRGCFRTREILTQCIPVKEEDWDTEYLEKILSVKIVSSLDEAIEHINRHSSGHTESILTESISVSEEFINRIDSSSVMVNASTRLADGSVYGLGAEIGISTDRLHARGPMGLEELTTYKWVVRGNGTIRE